MVNYSTDPGTDVFLRGMDAGERARKVRQALAVDTAVRRGLAQSMGGMAEPAPALAPQPGAQASEPAPAASPPLAPTPAPTPAQDAPETPPGGIPVPPMPPSSPPPLAPRAGAPAAATPASAPGPALAPAAPAGGGDRYDSVLRELTQVPGGGAAALGLMQQQDRAAVQMGTRRNQLAQLAMRAYRQGDVATGDYYADQAGIPRGQATAQRLAGAAGSGPARAAGRPLQIEVRRQMLIEAGVPPQQAALEAAGGTLSPSARAQIYLRVQSAVNADLMIAPERKASEVERRFTEILNRIGAASAPAASPSPTPTPSPAPAPAAPPEQPGFFRRLFGGGAPSPAALPPARQDQPNPALAPTPGAGAAAPPPPPRDPAQRVTGQPYTTPRGVFIWTGAGWRPAQ